MTEIARSLDPNVSNLDDIRKLVSAEAVSGDDQIGQESDSSDRSEARR